MDAYIALSSISVFFQARLAEIGYDEGNEENLRGERRQLNTDAERLRRQMEELEDRYVKFLLTLKTFLMSSVLVFHG